MRWSIIYSFFGCESEIDREMVLFVEPFLQAMLKAMVLQECRRECEIKGPISPTSLPAQQTPKYQRVARQDCR